MTITPIPTINQSRYDELINNIGGFDMSGYITGVMSIYTNVMGNLFYLLLWGIVFVMLWVRQGAITIPSTLGMILGAIVIAMLPSEFQKIAQVMIVMGFIAVIYVMFSERG